ncbi:hypothetical protein D0469_01910 [Peribacillus saganii]|uniref:Flagellar hook-length control protein-like C-terminal domain-containing protein n=1 Tax=Peribacillus saganii TaxID=2303992 RepID=A0A372LSW7_9BACI|nr:flagellar hook-length control protein FliK [Peribacillus saganii]RFU71289.1 hypothetical protein D0469_01910 [Peribacillus saganii]
MNATVISRSVSSAARTAAGKLSDTEIGNGEKEIFGSVLQSVLSSNKEASATGFTSIDQQKLTSEVKVLQDLLDFLEISDLSQVEGGFTFAEDVMFLGADIASHPFIQALLGIKDDSTLTNTVNNLAGLGNQPTEGEDIFQENRAELTIESLFFAVQSLLEKITLSLEGTGEKLNLTDAAGILKLAKVQELLTPYKDLSNGDATLSAKLKEMLETATEKLSVLLKETGPKNSFESTFTRLLSGSPGNSSLDTVQKAFQRNFGETIIDGNQKNEHTEKPLIMLKNTEGTTSFFHMQTTKVEQLVLTLEKSGQQVNQQQFIKEFQNLLSKANFSSGNGIQKLLIRLNPEHLGSIRIELIQKDDQLTAKIMATTARAKEMLDSQLQGLKHAFSGQNLQIEKIEISQQMNQFSQERFLQRDQDNHQQQRNNQQRQQQDASTENEDGFTESLEEALLNTKV